MKVLLTLFVLLFSIPAHSSDNLSGNKIVCSKVIGNVMHLAGFEFIGNFEVLHYNATNKNPLTKIRKNYKTSPEEISVIYPGITNHINRKNLSVTRYKEQYRNDSFQYKNDECRLYDASILDFISKKLEKYKEGNLL